VPHSSEPRPDHPSANLPLAVSFRTQSRPTASAPLPRLNSQNNAAPPQAPETKKVSSDTHASFLSPDWTRNGSTDGGGDPYSTAPSCMFACRSPTGAIEHRNSHFAVEMWVLTAVSMHDACFFSSILNVCVRTAISVDDVCRRMTWVRRCGVPGTSRIGEWIVVHHMGLLCKNH